MYNLNSDTHNINMRQKLNFLNIEQIYLYIKKGVHSLDIKVFSTLPQSLKKATGNIKQFKTALKCYLLTHSFYSIDEYFNAVRQ
jgi:hypothetical protein